MKKFIRKDDQAVSPVIAVILMVAITVVLAGVLWAMLSNIGPSDTAKVSISGTKKDKGTYYTVSISSVSGGDLNLDEAKFVMIDADGATVYSLVLTNADPAKFSKGESDVYALTKGSTVQDNSTSADVGPNSEFENYEGCYIAYIDGGDEKVTAGDTIHIYKDYDNDGTEDVESKYRFQIKLDDDIAFDKGL